MDGLKEFYSAVFGAFLLGSYLTLSCASADMPAFPVGPLVSALIGGGFLVVIVVLTARSRLRQMRVRE